MEIFSLQGKYSFLLKCFKYRFNEIIEMIHLIIRIHGIVVAVKVTVLVIGTCCFFEVITKELSPLPR